LGMLLRSVPYCSQHSKTPKPQNPFYKFCKLIINVETPQKN